MMLGASNEFMNATTFYEPWSTAPIQGTVFVTTTIILENNLDLLAPIGPCCPFSNSISSYLVCFHEKLSVMGSKSLWAMAMTLTAYLKIILKISSFVFILNPSEENYCFRSRWSNRDWIYPRAVYNQKIKNKQTKETDR